jgi:hypothetical protein
MSRTAWQRAAPDQYWKQNDTSPAVTGQLFDGTGTVVNLTGASVKFMAWFPGDATVKINAAATITDAANGRVSYTPNSTDTNTIGDMMAEWQVTFSGGAVETFPNWRLLKVRVTDDIAA